MHEEPPTALEKNGIANVVPVLPPTCLLMLGDAEDFSFECGNGPLRCVYSLSKYTFRKSYNIISTHTF